jgi:choline dehydrogenase
MHCLAEHQTLYHPVGTVAMGSDETAPLTPDLRVRGVSGLRVIDASVMPRIPNANTNAPTMLVAEVGAHAILES